MNEVSFPNVTTIFQSRPINPSKTHSTTSFEAQQKFSTVLKESIEKINETQIQSDRMTEKLVRGDKVDLHSVMIASQKASISLQAGMEIRNKVVEAYQEVMRMQV